MKITHKRHEGKIVKARNIPIGTVFNGDIDYTGFDPTGVYLCTDDRIVDLKNPDNSWALGAIVIDYRILETELIVKEN